MGNHCAGLSTEVDYEIHMRVSALIQRATYALNTAEDLPPHLSHMDLALAKTYRKL